MKLAQAVYQILFVVILQKISLGCFYSKSREKFTIDDKLLPYFANLTPLIGCETKKFDQIEKFVKFYHYTKENPIRPREIIIHRHETLRNWIYGAPVRILIHGFVDSKDLLFIPHVRRAYLPYMNFNIIAVDWSPISQSFCYRLCAEKVDSIGKYTAKFIQFLHHSDAKVKFSDIHLVGHSLGAHIAGATGKYLKPNKIAIIYGLDPAGPLFRREHPDFRLDPTDAKFVEVINTDGKDGLGIDVPIGYVDFYVNGAHNQPSCLGSAFRKIIPDAWLQKFPDLLMQTLNLCSHLRSYEIFAESLKISFKYDGENLKNTKGFWGIKCECAEQAFNKTCPFDRNIPLGKIASNPNEIMSGIYHVQTSKIGPNYALDRPKHQ